MATFQVSGTKTTVSFDYEALTAKAQSVIGACAEHLWKEETDEEGVTNPFADASNQDKLDIVDAHVKSVLLDMANSFISNKAQAEAREDAEDSKLML